MSNEELEPTPAFVKGFNGGYLLAKHEPELFKLLEKSLGKDSDYITGLKMGKKQHDKELLLQQIKQSQEQSRDRSREKEQ